MSTSPVGPLVDLVHSRHMHEVGPSSFCQIEDGLDNRILPTILSEVFYVANQPCK
jgi:hypothetical protein